VPFRRLNRALLLIGHGKSVDYSQDAGRLVLLGLVLALVGGVEAAYWSWATPWWPLNLALASLAFLPGYLLACAALIYLNKALAHLLIRLERTPASLARAVSDEALELLALVPSDGLWGQHLEALAAGNEFPYLGIDRRAAGIYIELAAQGLLIDRYGSNRLVARRGAKQQALVELLRREERLANPQLPGPRARVSPLGH
jgi:hypothetical protein